MLSFQQDILSFWHGPTPKHLSSLVTYMVSNASCLLMSRWLQQGPWLSPQSTWKAITQGGSHGGYECHNLSQATSSLRFFLPQDSGFLGMWVLIFKYQIWKHTTRGQAAWKIPTITKITKWDWFFLSIHISTLKNMKSLALSTCAIYSFLFNVTCAKP